MPIATGKTPVASGSRTPSRDLIAGRQYLVQRQGGPSRRATILEIRTDKSGTKEAYISYEGLDKRLDTWVKEYEVGVEVVGEQGKGREDSAKRRKLDVDDPSTPNGEASSSRRAEGTPSVASTPEREHAAMTRVRNFEDVRFGEYLIKTWYFSPYPMPLEEKEQLNYHNQSSNHSNPSTPLSSSSKKRKIDHSHPHTPDGGPTTTPNGGGKGGQLHKSASSRSVGEMLVAGVGKGGEGARGRLWVCDLCFKYMRTRDGWERHTGTCDLLTPPGRRVYQRGSYSIWEIDGAVAPLYCQNLSLFGKLFIDHKSVFFHVENFLFYVICDASTSRRDQVMAFFSKEKLSYDDYNLACIVTFPPCQNRGFGKLLIEFSYYLTKHPSTRPANLSPGTPERPLSDLGLKGYTAYWVSTVLQVCRRLLADAPPVNILTTPGKSPATKEARSLREKKVPTGGEEVIHVANGVEMVKTKDRAHRGQYAITTTMADLAKACHLRIDDTAFTLSELGLLKHRRKVSAGGPVHARTRRKRDEDGTGGEDTTSGNWVEEEQEGDLGEWKDVEVVITRGMVEELWEKWRVKEKGVLDESCVRL